MVLHLKQKPGSSPSSRVRNGSQVPVPRWAGRDQVPEREQAWSLGLSRVSPALGAEDFWLTAARNVLKLVVKSEWKSYSIQAEEEEAPGDKQLKKQEKKTVTVSPEFVDEALCVCEEHLSNLAHVDIDKDLEAPLYLSPEGWSLFLQRYYQVVQ